jgi:hypothetical protein
MPRCWRDALTPIAARGLRVLEVTQAVAAEAMPEVEG